jgi:hypothetical protein
MMAKWSDMSTSVLLLGHHNNSLPVNMSPLGHHNNSTLVDMSLHLAIIIKVRQ